MKILRFCYRFALLIIVPLSLSQQSNAQVGNLLWEENFDSLDHWIINTGNGNWGWGNGELQYYKAENVTIQPVPGEPGNNAVRIRALAESGPGIVDQWGNPLDYTSGKITSLSEVSVKYGMIETRIRVPDLDLGGWPAFWLLGTSNFGWPTKGELDMMEMGGTQAFRDRHDTHNGGNGQNNSTVNEVTGANAIYHSSSAVSPGNPNGVVSLADDPVDLYNRPYYNHNMPLNDRFIIYRMYWDEDEVRFTVEDAGNEYDLHVNPFALDTMEKVAFHEPFYFILNMAIGGTYTDCYNLGDPGSGLPVSFGLPADMYVDYIRVYEWNGMGHVHQGPPNQIPETFGVYTELTPVEEEHIIDEDAYVYVWEGTLNGAGIGPYEGTEVLSWATNGSGWFGAGVMSEQPINLSGFGDGTLEFAIQIPADVSFQIGITDAWSNQSYVDFPAQQTTYGLVRDGNWGRASIPIADLRGPLIDLRMMAYTFVILEVNGTPCTFALDDIYWAGGDTIYVPPPPPSSVVDPGNGDSYLTISPNPTRSFVEVGFALDQSEVVTINLFDVTGRKVMTQSLGQLSAGEHAQSIKLDTDFNGAYLLEVETENQSWSQRLVILE